MLRLGLCLKGDKGKREGQAKTAKGRCDSTHHCGGSLS
jgi:hypothetical protein